MEGVPTTIKFPKDRRARGRNATCTGWTLNTNSDDLISFSFEVNEEGCKKIEFTVDPDAASYDIEELNFTNDCGDGTETWTIKVQAILDEDMDDGDDDDEMA